MNIQEAIKEAKKTGKPIKREGWGNWLRIRNGYFYWAREVGEDYDVNLTSDDIMADDWKIKEEQIKEEWYEGEIEDKYPKGVFCIVSNGDFLKYPDVIYSYDKSAKRPFKGCHNSYKYAEFVSFEDIPDILLYDQVLNIRDIIRRLETKVSK